MSRGYRGAILTALGSVVAIAITIGFITWPNTPRLNAYRYENSYNRDYRPGGSQCAPEALAAIRQSRKRTRDTEACAKQAEEYRQNTGNLIQQTRSADAAYAQAQIAGQGLWTAWFQTIGGFVTLVAAIAAALYAREAAREARRSGNIAQESDRAWMVFDSVEARRSIGENKLTHGVNIWVKFINAGNSPALKTMSFIQMEIVKTKEEIEDFTFDELDNPESGHSVIGPQKTVGPSCIYIDRTTYTALFNRQCFAIIRGGIYYVDFYSRKNRTTENYFQFIPIHPPDVLFNEGDVGLYSQFLSIGKRSQAT